MKPEAAQQLNPVLANGHDAPVSVREDDFYDRWQIATAISRVIEESPAEWSTRIGLFGQWGDGKTSVLNFLEGQQKIKGNIVIRYSPWGASSEEEVWKTFGATLIKGLKNSGFGVGLKARSTHWFKQKKKLVGSFLKAGGTLAEASGHAPGAKVGTEVASNFIEKYLSVDRQDIERISSTLGKRRIIVFIDDLDRTDPAVVPKLLLALRELLDFSRFAFVLAFDRRIVASALEAHNSAWGKSGENFLDKVIDFQFDLPAPSREKIKMLAGAQFAKICPFVPSAVLPEIVNLLPANPRKLKLFVRMISSMKEEVNRHDAEELNWKVILVFALIRAESNAFAEELLHKTVVTGEVDWARWIVLDIDEKEKVREEDLKKIQESHPEISCSPARIKILLEAWRENIPAIPGEQLRYQASFSVASHCITWGEFKIFFLQWRANKSLASVTRFIQERMNFSEQTRKVVEKEFVQTITSHYATLLERAGQVPAGESHLAIMFEASDTLALLSQSTVVAPMACALPDDALMSCWGRLYQITRQWIHFNANVNEQELRDKEKELLVLFAARINKPLAIFEVLGASHEFEVFGERSAALLTALNKAIRDEIEPGAVAMSLAYLTTPGQMKRLRSRDEHQAARYMFTSPKSPLFNGALKVRLMTAVQARIGTREATEDAVDYMDLLLSALSHGDNVYCNAADRVAFILEHQNFMAALWDVCVSARHQYRFLDSLRKRREKLVEVGMDDALLHTPDWLNHAPV